MLDLDSLMALDEISERDGTMFVDERKLKRRDALKRKEAQ